MSGGEAVIFQNAVEGLERAFGKRLSKETRQQVKSLGIDLDDPVAGYQLEVWEQVVRLVAASLWPKLAPDDAWEQMGLEFMEGYLQTTIGKAAFVIGKLIGPRRLMERMGRNFRSAGNYLTAEAMPVAANEVQLTTRILDEYVASRRGKPTVMMRYRAGVLRGSLLALGRTGVVVEVLSWDPETQVARYKVRWDE